MKKVLSSAAVMVILSIPSAALAQAARDTTPAPTFRSTLQTQTLKAIDSRDFQKQFMSKGRSPLLLSLYGSLAALNVLDVVSTRQAMSRGAIETNPLMKDAIGGSRAFAIKAASTLATVLAIETVARKNRKAAIVMGVIANGVTAAIVANNLRQAR